MKMWKRKWKFFSFPPEQTRFSFFSLLFCRPTTKRTNRRRTATMKIEWKTELEKSKTWWVSREKVEQQQGRGGWRNSLLMTARKFSYWVEMCCLCSFSRWKRHAVRFKLRRITKSSELSVKTQKAPWKLKLTSWTFAVFQLHPSDSW